MPDDQDQNAPPETDKRTFRANISADEETMRGVYSTQALVSHTREEFLVDFCFFAPTQPQQGRLVSRVLMSPLHAKRFVRAMQENLRRYEAQFGELPEPPESTPSPNDPTAIQ